MPVAAAKVGREFPWGGPLYEAVIVWWQCLPYPRLPYLPYVVPYEAEVSVRKLSRTMRANAPTLLKRNNHWNVRYLVS
jgi:hypothetical protein